MDGTGAKRGWSLCVTVVIASLVAGTLAATPRADDQVVATSATCLGSTSPESLSSLFAAEPGGVIAADYQRAIALPGGRTLWLFQDATIRLPAPPPPEPGTPPPPVPPPTKRLLHNVGMLQTGSCFEVLRGGTAADPTAWLLANETVPFGHWFWPLDAEMGSDGRLYIHLAEMFERSAVYLSTTEPVGTRVVGINTSTMSVTFSGVPPSSSPSLYGFSMTSDASWTYLYGHCHRQFGWDVGPFGVRAHDLGCSAQVPVARVPKGQLFDAPSYWDGASWQGDQRRAVGVIPTAGRSINPTQIRFDGERFVALTKVDDWFGSTIHLDWAPTATGPWTNYARMPATPKCNSNTCNTYFASWVPASASTSGASNRTVVGLSHNRWDGRVTEINRPTFFTAPDPGDQSFALRCSLVDC